jgi:hypothetical protein
MKNKAVKLSEDDMAFLDGLCDAFDDLPDGAWQAACEDSIRECGRFDSYDPFDVWMAWVEMKSEEG